MQIRTSDTHPLRIDTLTIDGLDGQIGLTLCPGKKGNSSLGPYVWNRHLPTDAQAIANWGADLWLCLMEPQELKDWGVAHLPEVAAAQARFLHLPITDTQTPGARFETAWATVGPLVHARLKAGGKVLIHCRGGLGRAGTLAARLLVEFGADPETAIRAVRRARTGTIENRHQEGHVRRMAARRGIAWQFTGQDLPSSGTCSVTDSHDSSAIKRRHQADRADRACAGLLGLLIGDALGVPHEFKSPSQVPPKSQIEMLMPGHYPRSYAHVPPGTWSDDGAQALCLLESLLEQGALDTDDLGEKLLRWWVDGHLAVDGEVFDIGIQTRQALNRLRAGVPAVQAGSRSPDHSGNGSLMRVLGLALWHRGSLGGLFEQAMRQSLVTHGSLQAQLCCALYCGVASHLLDGQNPDTAWMAAKSALLAWCAHDGPLSQVLRQDILGSPLRHEPGGSGHVVDTLWSVRACLRQSSYASVVREAIAMGNDTDTTAAIAGGLAGIVFGQTGIPAHWQAALRGRELAEPILQALRARHA